MQIARSEHVYDIKMEVHNILKLFKKEAEEHHLLFQIVLVITRASLTRIHRLTFFVEVKWTSACQTWILSALDIFNLYFDLNLNPKCIQRDTVLLLVGAYISCRVLVLLLVNYFNYFVVLNPGQCQLVVRFRIFPFIYFFKFQILTNSY